MCYYPECAWANVCKPKGTMVQHGKLWAPEGCPQPPKESIDLEQEFKKDEVLEKIEEYCKQHNFKRRHVYLGQHGVSNPVWLTKKHHHLSSADLYAIYKESPEKFNEISLRWWDKKSKKWWQFWI